jgi:hypothetical protein
MFAPITALDVYLELETEIEAREVEIERLTDKLWAAYGRLSAAECEWLEDRDNE